ncbi:50S ribosomal protein L15 [Candidatus Parcubacteria bacterium]|nr:50S ribosomal protein L15 [Candidatus Parcubacteria bacterium]
MSLSLNTIKPAEGSTKNRKRIGRGNASGTGTYAGKGQKGQKCRSGVSNLKRLGMKQVLLRTPKHRGFKSFHPKNQVVSFESLNEVYKDKEEVNPETLFEKKVVSTLKAPVKILDNGDLKVKDLKFKNIKASKSAFEKIKKAGGKF